MYLVHVTHLPIIYTPPPPRSQAQYWLEYTLSNYTTASLLTHECLRIVYVYPLFVPLKMTALNGIRYFLKAFLDLPPNFKTVLGEAGGLKTDLMWDGGVGEGEEEEEEGSSQGK